MSTPAGTNGSTAHVGGTRARVLTALRVADAPVGVDDLAETLGLHRNTVRFHTQALVTAGLVEEGRQQNGGKGRPRAVFAATSDGARVGQRNYQLLASALVDHVARTSPDPAAAARAAGRSWGQRLAVTTKGHPRRRTSVPAAVELLDAMGFEPRLSPRPRPTQIQMYNCPFREIVDEHQDLTCAIHAGLLEGMMAPDPDPRDAGQPPAFVVPRLEPFAAPNLCVIHLLRPSPAAPVAEGVPPC